MKPEQVRELAASLVVAAQYAQMVLPDDASATDDATMANAHAAFALAERALPVLTDALVSGYRQPGPFDQQAAAVLGIGVEEVRALPVGEVAHRVAATRRPRP